jgi:imidazolonepropionase-like amidohydrolase
MTNKTDIDLVINNVNILTMIDNRVLSDKAIFIRNGRILCIDENIRDPEGYPNLIDGQKGYILPGIVNMHTHLGDNRLDLLLYLVNGVTSIRNMWGYEGFRFRHWLLGARLFNHLLLKQQIEDGKVIGPSIYTAGPLLDGAPPFFPDYMYLHSVKEKSQIELIIRNQVNQGYDFVKIYSNLSGSSFDDIVEIAKKYAIPVAGHVPDAVDVQHALESRIRSIEHLYGFTNPYHPERNKTRPDIKRLAALAARNGVWNCPTLIAHERLADVARRPEFENEPQMNYVAPRNRRSMRFLMKASYDLFHKKGLKGNQVYQEDHYFIIQQLERAGAGLLLGTDKSVPYVVAGFSEHAEMQLLSQAGLSNYEVLKAATVNAAKCLGQENEFGTIKKGARADLILTLENPLLNLSTLLNHAGVIKFGIYYSRAKCDEILNRIKTISSKQII